MFRDMRRSDRMASQEEGRLILQRCVAGVLSVLGDDDYPYGVPVSYAYKDNYIFIHCFLEGHKIDAIRKHPKVCFTVTADEEVMKEQISTNYSSVIVFGIAELFPPPENEVRETAFAAIIDKYIPGDDERTAAYIKGSSKNTNVIRINIEHMSVKKRNIR